MSTLFYRNRRLLVLTLVMIVVAGLSAFRLLPRREDPELIARFALVLTYLPGADAERVEALVTKPIEDEIRELAEIKELVSSSRGGVSMIQVELADDVTDPQRVMTRVRDKLDEAQAELPPEASRPEVRDSEVEAFVLVIGLQSKHDRDAPSGIVRRLAEDLEDRFRNLPGTRETKLFGDPEEEIEIIVDLPELAAAGLSPRDVSERITRSDAKVRAGKLRGDQRVLLVEVEGEIDSLDRLRRLPIRTHSDGRSLRLGDIATVRRTVRSPAREMALFDGRPGVAVGVRLASGQRIDQWRARAEVLLRDFEQNLSRGVELDLLFDQSRYTLTRLDELTRNFLLGALAVMVVIFFVMGARSAVLVGIALPLTSLMVLAGLRFLGIALHQMSVTGLVIALGLLIDNAIVIVDDVRGLLRQGVDRLEAVRRSVGHLAVPLFGSTLTTVLAFMPIALLPGAAGDFVYSIAMSVILALASSYFLAMTLLPALTAWTDKPTGRGFLAHGLRSEWLANRYRRALDFVIRRPVLGITLAVILPIVGFVQASTLDEQFFPSADRDQIQVQIQLPSHASLTATRQASEHMRAVAERIPEVQRVHFYVGTSAPMFYYNMLTGRDDTPSFAQGIVQLDSHERATEIAQQLQHELNEELPEAQVLVSKFEQGPPFPAPVELHIFGPDLERLADLGEDVRSVLATVPGVTHTRTTLRTAQPKLLFSLDEEATRIAGFDEVRLAAELEASLEGGVGGSLLEGTEQLPVRVRVADHERSRISALASLELPASDDTIPLSSLGSFELQPQLSNVSRRDGRRVNSVQAFIEPGLLPDTVRLAFADALQTRGVRMPVGYTTEFGGESAKRNDAVGNLMASVLMLGVLMVATLVLSFQSFRLAGLIMLVAGLSFGVGLASLWTFGQVFGFMAIVGTLGLMGVAVNDSIVVLAALRGDPKASSGDPDAMREVVFGTSRHVFATTVTTIAGFMPLIISGGGFWPPLAIAIAGGVTGATVLALVLVPAAYRLVAMASTTMPRNRA